MDGDQCNFKTTLDEQIRNHVRSQWTARRSLTTLHYNIGANGNSGTGSMAEIGTAEVGTHERPFAKGATRVRLNEI